jgi:hypothetical protein
MPITLGPGLPARPGPHVLLVEFLDCLPVEVEFLGDLLDRRLPAAPSNEVSKRGEARLVRYISLHAIPVVDVWIYNTLTSHYEHSRFP